MAVWSCLAPTPPPSSTHQLVGGLGRIVGWEGKGQHLTGRHGELAGIIVLTGLQRLEFGGILVYKGKTKQHFWGVLKVFLCATTIFSCVFPTPHLVGTCHMPFQKEYLRLYVYSPIFSIHFVLYLNLFSNCFKILFYFYFQKVAAQGGRGSLSQAQELRLGKRGGV